MCRLSALVSASGRDSYSVYAVYVHARRHGHDSHAVPVMKITRIPTIISGGQTGVDRTALEVAKAFAVPTGGWVPKGYRTDDGADPTLKQFNVNEHDSPAYPPRTEYNVLYSHGTAIFGVTSPGCRLTVKLCKKHKRPYIENPDPWKLMRFVLENNIQVLNVAGNRLRTHPESAELCRTVLTEFFTLCLKPR